MASRTRPEFGSHVINLIPAKALQSPPLTFKKIVVTEKRIVARGHLLVLLPLLQAVDPQTRPESGSHVIDFAPAKALKVNFLGVG